MIGFQNQHGSSRSSVTPKSAHQALNMHMEHIQRKAHTSEIKIHEKIKSLFHSKIKLSYGVFYGVRGCYENSGVCMDFLLYHVT